MKLTGDVATRRRKVLRAFVLSLVFAVAGFCLAAKPGATSAKRGCDDSPVGPFDITQCELLTNAVLVHFDTEANRRYELQFTTNAFLPGSWKKLYVAEAVPFPNHFIWYHQMTNGPTGCFRLLISP